MLSSLELQNFRPFEDAHIAFDPSMTVLIGNNGAGKSAILDAAAIALGAFLIRLPDSKGKNHSRKFNKDTDVRRVSFRQGDQVQTERQYPVRVTAHGYRDDLPHDQAPEMMWARQIRSTGHAGKGDCKEINAYADECQQRVQAHDENLILPVLGYYGTGRVWTHKKTSAYVYDRDFSGGVSRLNGYIDCLDAYTNDNLMRYWFMRMALQSATRKKESPLYTAVRKAMASCVAHLQREDASAIDVEYSVDLGQIIVTYRHDNDVTVLPIGMLSDGYRSVMSMVGDIAFRMAMLNPALGVQVVSRTSGVVLIDEIDLHLHPKWQEHILEVLTETFPKVQFIVTSHAPLVLSSVKDSSCLRIIDETGGRPYQGHVTGSSSNDVLTHVMGAHDRPGAVRDMFKRLEQALDDSAYDQAKTLLDELESLIGPDDAELARERAAYDFMTLGGE